MLFTTNEMNRVCMYVYMCVCIYIYIYIYDLLLVIYDETWFCFESPYTNGTFYLKVKNTSDFNLMIYHFIRIQLNNKRFILF